MSAMRYLFSSKRAPSGSKGARRMKQGDKLEHACTWANSHIENHARFYGGAPHSKFLFCSKYSEDRNFEWAAF